jgi:hypothetical protein
VCGCARSACLRYSASLDRTSRRKIALHVGPYHIQYDIVGSPESLALSVWMTISNTFGRSPTYCISPHITRVWHVRVFFLNTRHRIFCVRFTQRMVGDSEEDYNRLRTDLITRLNEIHSLARGTTLAATDTRLAYGLRSHNAGRKSVIATVGNLRTHVRRIIPPSASKACQTDISVSLSGITINPSLPMQLEIHCTSEEVERVAHARIVPLKEHMSGVLDEIKRIRASRHSSAR